MTLPRVVNEKEVSESGKAVIYRMERVVSGHRIGAAIAITFCELEHGRAMVARKLWATRAKLQARALLVDRWLEPKEERRAQPRALTDDEFLARHDFNSHQLGGKKC